MLPRSITVEPEFARCLFGYTQSLCILLHYPAWLEGQSQAGLNVDNWLLSAKHLIDPLIVIPTINSEYVG
jgi:hypothetical protein